MVLSGDKQSQNGFISNSGNSASCGALREGHKRAATQGQQLKATRGSARWEKEETFCYREDEDAHLVTQLKCMWSWLERSGDGSSPGLLITSGVNPDHLALGVHVRTQLYHYIATKMANLEDRTSEAKDAPAPGQATPDAGTSEAKDAPAPGQAAPDAGTVEPVPSQAIPDAGISEPKGDPSPSQENPDPGPSAGKDAPAPASTQEGPGAGKVDPAPGQASAAAGELSEAHVDPASNSSRTSTGHSKDPAVPRNNDTALAQATRSQEVVTNTPASRDKGSQSLACGSPGEALRGASPSPSQPCSTAAGGTLGQQGPGTSPSVTSPKTPAISTAPVTDQGEKSAAGDVPVFPGTTAFTTLLPPAPAPPSSSMQPTFVLGNNRVQCEAPEKPDEKMLVLNLTKTSLCQAKSPPDENLITVLCKTAKSSFNPARDQCHIRLAPVPEDQAVLVKQISVQTILQPGDIYERLKDKWDDLQEVGVSDMQLGDQGPPEEAEDRFSMPLIITIVCMASFLLLVAALYGCCHQRLSHRKDQQRLTEELQTVENGYHDNPTLEVMETSSEMQEKKVVNLNGELGDSWIVPLDNLTKEELEEEEDTHL
ncbi:podocalyxin [Echinops telfairi]|uniref:Podocalyxin n=1 Tax=Echinops telfairi TaxID=9371 RepID=A0AC55CZE3_ECHTE|nr:podocalyxin [Echinops telfairi]